MVYSKVTFKDRKKELNKHLSKFDLNEGQTSCPAFMAHKEVLFDASLFAKRNNFFLTHTVQKQGEFVITWPYAYHSGYNIDANIAEGKFELNFNHKFYNFNTLFNFL